MKSLYITFFLLMSLVSFSQVDSDSSIVVPVKVVIERDPRLELLGKKLSESNHTEKKISERTAMGFRLQVLSTNDREFAMKTRTSLLQKYPEQKTYMFYQAPFVKIRFGNFRSKADAEVYKRQISRMLGGASIYTVSERIEVKPEKDKEEDEEN